jgi:hypothetical protein
MTKIYYWKVSIPAIKKELIVYAHNIKECDTLTQAWLKRQNLNVSYDKGRAFAIKKNTPLDIVEQEYNHLC